MDIIWNGITKAETLNKEYAAIRHALADAAKSSNRHRVCQLISEHKELANSCRPDGSSLFTPLHQAAHGGASVGVIQQLVSMGAWRTVQNARGEQPVDVAVRTQHTHLLAALEPVYRHSVPLGVLLKIQYHFHAVIRGRVEQLLQEHVIRLPELEPLLELDRPQMWFPVPGMYGGFSYRLDATGVNARLVSESWCRIEGGSGERHVITTEGSTLEDEGFV
jgi:hypothetical protein